jgi:4-hydroxythreonine-4-phosphate dehydrogenase
MMPDFIFMLTHQDRTIANAHERLDEVLAAGIRHIGFKDVGLPFGDLQALATSIRQAGARLYLEVVSLDEASEQASARSGLDLEVDVLMGGTRPEVVLPVIRGTPIRYYPFPGTVVGHPSVLVGTPVEIRQSAQWLAAIDGVHGLDLLAYRCEGDASGLIREICRAVPKPVVVAGSIDCQERIDAVVNGGAAGFTIGTAALDNAFPASEPGLTGQLRAITEMVSQAVLRHTAQDAL